MTEPALREMRRDVGLKGVNAERMPQALRHGGRAGDAGRRHDSLDVAPRCRAAPAPKPQRRELRNPLRDPQLEHAIKLAKQVRRQGRPPDDPPLAALESLNARKTARSGRKLRRFKKYAPLGGVQMFPVTGWTEEALTIVRLLALHRLG